VRVIPGDALDTNTPQTPGMTRAAAVTHDRTGQEINALDDEPLECVVARSGQEPIVVNLDIDGVVEPEHVPWVDAAHPVVH
jgi:uncharacterized RmlC-like cupin family protein